MSRVEEQLHGGQSLLPVDNRRTERVACRTSELLDDDRPKEVPGECSCGNRVTVSAEQGLGDASDVVPQRLPLVLLRPDVRALERWDLVTDLAVEEITRSQCLGFHFQILSMVPRLPRSDISVILPRLTDLRHGQQTPEAGDASETPVAPSRLVPHARPYARTVTRTLIAV